MIDLDDPASLAADASAMLARVRALGSELLRAWQQTAAIEPPRSAQPLENVVIAGMGGSATAGDYFATLCAEASPIPVVVVRGSRLPRFVSPGTLVIVSSYSGNTAEALACYEQACAAGAPTFVISHGGQLSARAARHGTPVAHIDYISPPRAAIAHTLAPLLRLGSLIGTCEVGDASVENAARACDTYISNHLAPDIPTPKNTAKACATRLWRHTPLVLASEHLGPAAVRFKNQLAENGKTLAATELLPEAAHNFVVGLQTVRDDAARLSVVMLDSALYSPPIQRVTREMRRLFEQRGIPVTSVQVPGDDLLGQAWAATALGDYVSCYVALLHGLDPTPIPEIERMRAVAAE